MARSKAPQAILTLTMFLGTASAVAETERVMDGDALWRSESNYKQAVRAWEDMDAGELEQAIERFTRVVNRAQGGYERSQALLGLAQAQLMRRDVASAIGHYEEVVRLNHAPDKPHFEVMLKLAELHFRLDNTDQASTWLQRWSNENPMKTAADRQRARRLEERLFGQGI